MIRALTLALFCAPAAAATIGLHLGSLHSTSGWCDYNPGVYARLDSGATFGAFRNSECRTSAYAGWTWEVKRGKLSAALTAGAITGYVARPVLPLFVPSIKVSVVRLSYTPKINRSGAHALHFSIERDF